MSKKCLILPFELLILSFFAIISLTTQAENDLKFNHLTVNDGLLHNTTTCIAQDSSGFIWIGTQRGLNRFDGYKIDSYLNKGDVYTTVFNNRIRKIEVKGNYLWVATMQGLQCFDIRKKEYIDFIDEDRIGNNKLQTIHSLLIDKQNRIWIGVKGKTVCALIVEDKNGIRLKNVKINNQPNFSLLANYLAEVVELANGTIILLTNGKLYELQNKNVLDLKSKPVPTPFTDITKIHSDGNDLWLFSNNKAIVVRYAKGKLTILDEIKFPSLSVREVSSSANFIWITTNQGVMQIAKARSANRIQFHSHSVLDPYSVCSDHHSDILIDNKNNLWVSTYSGGVSYTNIGKQKFELIKYMPNSSNKYLPSEFVYSIHEDIKGHIYVGTKFGGVSRFNVQTKTFDYTIDLHQKLGYLATVPCIQSDDEWIYALVSYQGSNIYRIHKLNQKIELVKSFSPNTAFSFGFDKHQQLWVGVLGIGLYCLKIENAKVVNEKLYTINSDPELNLSSNDVNFIFNDKQKNEVLISTTNGINRLLLDEKGVVSGIAYYIAEENKPNSLSSNYVWPIDKENDSTYWVGTMGTGLNRIIIGKRVVGTAEYKAEHFGTNEGAPSNDIESVLVDKFGRVWCGGRYLSSFDYKTKKFKTYYEEDGLQSYLFATGTSCKSRNGMLFFGGLKGMNYFMPDTTVERQNYNVVFSRLLIDGKVLHVADTLNGRVVLGKDLQFLSKLKIPYPCNNLTIEFTSLTYSRKKNIQYRYKLRGFDNDWIYTNGLSPYASYSKLPYKNYHFVVEVGIDNHWQKSGNIIEIKMLPPWWQSVWAYLIYFAIVSVLVYIAARYSLNWINLKRQISLQNEREKQKEELMELKMNFFTNISHEFKTPLTLINNSVSEIENKFEQLIGNRYFQILKRNNSKLLHLISELMDFQRLDASLIELKTAEIDVCKFVQEIVDEFLPLSESSGIELNLSLPTTPILAWVDEECLTKIISNVISNSIRYTERGGAIHVELSVGKLDNYKTKFNSKVAFTEEMHSGKQLIIGVTDTGIGITSESLPEIFERFHTVLSKTSKHLGSGVGLALVKSLVELHKGGVLISSERFVGTEFVFTIPLDADYLNENQKTTDNQFDRQLFFNDYKVQMLDEEIAQIDETDDSKPSLLLVDDNKDILMILKEHFKADYNILLAEDGEEALKTCNDKFPDIIISDVMMPKMNGLELCNIIKSQFNTCFIPVILLTARGTTEQQIEGLDEGADAYIPKPFHLGLLHSTIINLLKKSKLANQQIKPNELDVNEINTIRNKNLNAEKQQFIEKLTQIIENNIDNSDYSVDKLCVEIGISRSRLYLKMKDITNDSLGNYIRNLRLQKATELLRNTNLSISEIAYQVGFQNTSFFSRSFKQRFGISPTEFSQKHNNNN